MIEEATGSLFDATADALVNTVNTVGVMGKGLALQFKRAYPKNFEAYAEACRRNDVRIGELFVHRLEGSIQPRFILNFPTKEHWRNDSKLEYIEAGLRDLLRNVERLDLSSVALPPLGCGNGNLEWSDVRPLIERAAAQIPLVRILLYSPSASSHGESAPVRTARPTLTPARAGLLGLFESYLLPGHRLTRIEAQKLAYFLQEAGEKLRLSFKKHLYGPYAHELTRVLEALEGHYTRGLGDLSRHSSIRVLPESVGEIESVLRGTPTRDRVNRVLELIDGFETPYGLELLASLHYVARGDVAASFSLDAAFAALVAWNERKRDIFGPNRDHVELAWRRLKEKEWL